MNAIIAEANRYWQSVGRKELAHYRAAEGDDRRNQWIGWPSVITSTIVATSIFAALNQSTEARTKIAAGFVAVVAAVLAALQTFLGYGERAEKHRLAGARYGKVRRQLDGLLLKCQDAGAKRDQVLADFVKIGEDLSAVENETPSLSKSEYLAGRQDFDKDHPPKHVPTYMSPIAGEPVGPDSSAPLTASEATRGKASKRDGLFGRADRAQTPDATPAADAGPGRGGGARRQAGIEGAREGEESKVSPAVPVTVGSDGTAWHGDPPTARGNHQNV
jgi:hypothetical protein